MRVYGNGTMVETDRLCTVYAVWFPCNQIRGVGRKGTGGSQGLYIRDKTRICAYVDRCICMIYPKTSVTKSKLDISYMGVTSETLCQRAVL
jgi:hypothetical protein